MRLSIKLASENATKKFAALFARHLKKKDMIKLVGDLGVGKSYFTRSVLQSLNPDLTEVPSPTFTLVQSYQTPHFEVYHYDFYRLKSAQEIDELNFEEALTEVSFIEWPELLQIYRPKAHQLSLFFKMADNPEARLVELEGDESWQERLKLIEKEWHDLDA